MVNRKKRSSSKHKSSKHKSSRRKSSRRKSASRVKKPLSPECQKMVNIRKRFNIKAFNEGTVFKSGHKYNSKQHAISSAFNQVRKLKPDCFD